MSHHSNIVQVLPNIINQLGIKNRYCGNYWQCRCPLHGSTKYNSMTIFQDGGWKCWTSNCNERWGSNIYGLIKGLGADPKKLLDGVDYTIKYSEEDIDLVLPVLDISREDVRKRLEIPSKFYLDRGFDPELLDKFDVGDCHTPKTEMRGRAVFPIYNQDWGLIGCAGRTLLDKKYIQKWKYSEGFKSGRSFFALNHAHDHIQKTKTVVLVEGQSDVMMMHHYGIKNCIGAFGAKLSVGQSKLLKEMQVENIVLALDPDPPKERNGQIIEGTGPMRMRQITKRFGEEFNITPIILKSDPDEMKQDEAERVFGKYV